MSGHGAFWKETKTLQCHQPPFLTRIRYIVNVTQAARFRGQSQRGLAGWMLDGCWIGGRTNQAARLGLQIGPHKIESTGTADSTGYVHDTHEPAGSLAALPSIPATVFFSWERPRSLPPFISGSHHNETSRSLSLVESPVLPIMSRGQPRRSCVTTVVQQAGTNPSHHDPCI